MKDGLIFCMFIVLIIIIFILAWQIDKTNTILNNYKIDVTSKLTAFDNDIFEMQIKYDDKIAILKCKIQEQQAIIEQLQKQVNDMVLGYTTIDQALDNMFGKNKSLFTPP